MLRKLQIVPFFWLLITVLATAQHTVGLLSYVPEASFKGYNLIYPHNQSNVYLFNNCGELVHSWEDEPVYRPGNTAYILENGNLVKTKRHFTSAVNDPIWAGGGGETVEIRDWDNNVLHSFTLNDSLFRLHHDIVPLPNGNVLMLAWEKKTYAEAVAAGRNPNNLPNNELWSEAVLEWNPSVDSIVWSWHLWDHLIQDFDIGKANFGVVANHPELIDINYDESNGHKDWLHINAIDYNPVLDQFVLSIPNFNEFWIINHAISREETQGEAGDILYRWGNPAVYQRGNLSHKKLFFQHGVHWLNAMALPGEEDFGRIALFNNRVSETLSTANIVNTGVDATTKTYPATSGVFQPDDFQQIIVHPANAEKAVSASVSSVQKLPNGNFLICSGQWGYAYELTPDNQLVWEYVVPLKAGAPVAQGVGLNLTDNLTFMMNRYAPTYPAFEGKNVEPKGYIERNPDKQFCETLTALETIQQRDVLNVYPNPAIHTVILEKLTPEPTTGFLYDIYGRLLKILVLNDTKTILNVQNLHGGLYFITFQTGNPVRLLIQK